MTKEETNQRFEDIEQRLDRMERHESVERSRRSSDGVRPTERGVSGMTILLIVMFSMCTMFLIGLTVIA